MPASIIKVHQDHDLYVRFSTVVMGITDQGTRAEMKALYPTLATDEVMDRVDRTGTSDEPGDYQQFTWGSSDPLFNDDEVFMVGELPGMFGIAGRR